MLCSTRILSNTIFYLYFLIPMFEHGNEEFCYFKIAKISDAMLMVSSISLEEWAAETNPAS